MLIRILLIIVAILLLCYWVVIRISQTTLCLYSWEIFGILFEYYSGVIEILLRLVAQWLEALAAMAMLSART